MICCVIELKSLGDSVFVLRIYIPSNLGQVGLALLKNLGQRYCGARTDHTLCSFFALHFCLPCYLLPVHSGRSGGSHCLEHPFVMLTFSGLFSR